MKIQPPWNQLEMTRGTFLLILLPPRLPAAELFLCLSSGIGQPSIIRTKPIYCREEKLHLWKFRYHWGWRESKLYQEWHLPTSVQTVSNHSSDFEKYVAERMQSVFLLLMHPLPFFQSLFLWGPGTILSWSPHLDAKSLTAHSTSHSSWHPADFYCHKQADICLI